MNINLAIEMGCVMSWYVNWDSPQCFFFIGEKYALGTGHIRLLTLEGDVPANEDWYDELCLQNDHHGSRLIRSYGMHPIEAGRLRFPSVDC